VPLDEYRRKRDARRTPEPVPTDDPAVPLGPGHRFVIQEHHARRLHWDVRLERDGVLASWAVPKGLPTDPETVRLAVRTEDHPIEYLEFSGEIPAGEYGGGAMTIWDSGTYETEKWNPREVIVRLRGERASGRFVFIRTDRGGARDGGKDNWLLRRSDRDGGREPLPHEARPMLATPGPLPTDGEWWLQVGFGGLRVIVRAEGGRILITDAEGDEVAAPSLRELGPSLGATQALLDAELVGGAEGAYLWIGDLLHVDGRDAGPLPFRERRALLERLPLDGPRWRLAPVFPGAGPEVLAAAAQQGLPHIVAKDPQSAYEPGRTSARWVQVSTGKAAPVQPPARQRRTTAPGVGRAGLSNPDKVLYPLTGTTKADVLAYYLAVADVMLPHLRDRPVTLVRWPDGVERSSFFEKDVSRHAPRWLRTARVGTPGGRSEKADFPLVDDAEGLAWAANLAALELHVPQWRVGPRGAQQLPDLVVFDLDPGEGTTVVDCARVAERIAERLAEDGLVAYPRTSGGKGMQLYLPVAVSRAERTSEFAKALAEDLARETPGTVTAVMAKARRRGKVFVDWSQNNPYKTTIASYSLRGRARPTVATPVTWDEVRACRRPDDLVFTAADLPARIAEHGDLLAPLFTEPQRLPRRG
jgi:bifunctional non-homologous end joining protein LigD